MLCSLSSNELPTTKRRSGYYPGVETAIRMVRDVHAMRERKAAYPTTLP